MRSSSAATVVLTALALALTGCDKLMGLIKSEPDAAVTAVVDAAPVVPVESAAAVADAATTPTTPTAKPVVVARKDAGPVDAAAAAVDAAVALIDAGTDAAFVPKRATRGAFTCDSPGCQCEPGVSCEITCPASGACNVVVREIATATIRGGSTPLTLQCNKGATCRVQGGVGASRTRCTGAKCDVECSSGACNLTCESGAKCTIAKKGSGSVKCDGC